MADLTSPLRRAALAAGCALAMSAVAPAGLHQDAPDLLRTLTQDEVLARAATYVGRFERSMSTVVLEERYVQIVKPWMLPPREPDEKHLAWFDDPSAVRPDVIVSQRRQTRSDLLLVQLPDQRWTAFRDTFEVNGREQRRREDRLRKLFLEQSEDSRRQLRRIHQRSAEFNLGGFYREINLPTTGLLVAHSRYQQRFAFEAGNIAQRSPAACRLVSFNETTTPTLVRSVTERDVPMRGQLCVAEDGAVWSTRLDLDPRYTVRGVIDVTYAPHAQAEVLVPERMWEWYVLPEPDRRGLPAYVEALATYSNLRKFTVTTSETVKP
ncbi:MAG TPA: hypothetical protein VK886_23025 [Vicinamibacterales bacterium]|nr:hypothetical protein [Vicinamibacterales bacterium]